MAIFAIVGAIIGAAVIRGIAYDDHSDHSDYSDAEVRRQKELEVKREHIRMEMASCQSNLDRMLREEMAPFLADTKYADKNYGTMKSETPESIDAAARESIAKKEREKAENSTRAIQHEIDEISVAISELEAVRRRYSEEEK